MRQVFATFAVLALVVAACSSPTPGEVRSTQPFSEGECTGRFVVHELDHLTRGPGVTTSTFDGTGSGLAVADLDADRDLDLVLANLTGETALFRNQGSGQFVREPLISGRFRHVAVVDITGDTGPDLILTTGIGSPVVLESRSGGVSFQRVESPFDAFAYSMTVADFGGDGDLDIVMAAYNAELTANRSFTSTLAGRSGVWVYEATGAGYETTKLADTAQALAVHVVDIDGDGSEDIWVGNDLLTPDGVYLQTDSGWETAEPFVRTAFSTMSLDSADLDNDGDEDLLATDMHPMTEDRETLEAWEPIFEDMDAQPRVDDVQQMANALLRRDGSEFAEIAADMGVDASGWSWSGVFGDLDNDGFSDLYIVNGMQAEALFPDLPDNELVEVNQAYRNAGDGSLVPAPHWALDTTTGGRAAVMADLDGDGDLDVAVNNLGSLAAWYENQLCDIGGSIVIALEGLAGNANALGAVIEVTSDDATYLRRVAATRGYLSSVPAQVHVGVGSSEVVDIEITWPDGTRTVTSEVATGQAVVIAHPGESN